MPIQCPTCFRVNPADAAYCYYDGRGLNHTALKGSLGLGTQPFPLPFSFSDGQGCTNFNQLVLACNDRWNEARNYLINGTWKSYFGAIGRTDLAALAVQSSKESDLDVGLCRFLEGLPADTEALRPPKLALSSIEEDLGALEPGKDYKLEVAIANQGMLMLRGTAMTDCDWLSFGDQRGNFSTKLFQTRDTYSLSMRVAGSQFRAGKAPLEGQIVIDTNGGRQTVVVRATVPIRPFPKGLTGTDVLAGAASPREIAIKAKAHPKEAAVLFEQGAVKAWYQSNGWTYPVRSTQAKGTCSVQQFFEALGLSKPPKLEINTEKIVCEGHAGESVTQKVIVRTAESKYVYAEAYSNQDWIKILPPKPQGNSVAVPLCIEIPPRPGETLEAIVTVLGNGQQRFVVPVSLTVAAQSVEQEEQAARRSRWRQWGLAGGVVFLGLVIALAVVINHRRSHADDSSSDDSANAQAPDPPPKVEHWWDDIPGTNLTASVAELKKAAPKHRAIFARIESKEESDRREGYEQLADKLSELARNPKTRKALGRFVEECCVYEPSDFDIEPLLRDLKSKFPPVGEADDVELAIAWVGFVSDAITHKFCREVRPERSRSLASDLGSVLGTDLDASIPRKEFKAKGETALAESCYRNLRPMSEKSIDLALTMREVLIAKLGQRLKPIFRDREDLKLLKFLEPKDESALPVVHVVQHWTADNSSTVRKELVEMLSSRLPNLKADQIKALIPLLRHKDPKIVLVVLKEVEDRKDEASDLAAEVVNLIRHGDPTVREAAVKALLAMGAAVETAVPELSKRLLPLLSHEDKNIVVAGLRIVETRKEKSADLAEAVVLRLKANDAAVRAAAANALLALGTAADKPHSVQVLALWREEKDLKVKRALKNLLTFRIGHLTRRQMQVELRPLLRDKQEEFVLVALKVVQDREAEAADVAEEVADLLKRKNQPQVYQQTLLALKALGATAVDKTLPKLFDILEKNSRQYQRTPLALTMADIVNPKDPASVERLVPFLLEGLHAKAIESDREGSSEDKINQALLKIGQPAVDGCLKKLKEIHSSMYPDTDTNIRHRIKLYTILAKLGDTCKSQRNYDELKGFWKTEGLKKFPNKDVNTAAREALKKMEP